MKSDTQRGILVRRSIYATAVGALLIASPAFGEIVRWHGLDLNEQYKLMVEQHDDYVEIFLTGRERLPGGPLVQTAAGGDTKIMHRVEDRETLVRIRATVLRTAPPNNLSNPGTKYRIVIEGVDILPDLVVIHELQDTQVRDVLAAELEQIGARAGGIYRDAMRLGASIALGVLKANGQLPAQIPLTIERSEVGQIRGLGQGLTRQSLPAGRTLNPLTQAEESTQPERTFTFSGTTSDSGDDESEGAVQSAPGASVRTPSIRSEAETP